MKTLTINNFSGGISDDIRQETSNGFALTKHFDIYSNPQRLTPYRSSVADTTVGEDATAMKTYEVKNFVFASDNDIYGLGITAANKAKIFQKTDPTAVGWTLPATAEAANAGIEYDCFIEWGTTPALYMFTSTNKLSKWTLGSTFTDEVLALSANHSTVAQGVKAKDDNLYVFYNNIVVRVAPDGTPTDSVLTLPANGKITSACNYGNYLAIAWRGTDSSIKVYIWDLISSDVTERIDWGEGAVTLLLGNIDGVVVGVSDQYLSSSLGIGIAKVDVSYWAGGTPQTIKEIEVTSTGLLRNKVIVKDKKMYWSMEVPFNGDGGTAGTPAIWSVSKNTNGQYAVTLDHIEEASNTANGIEGFGNAGNYWFIAHSADGSITKTNSSSAYTETSVYESQKLLNSKEEKELNSVFSTFAYLPAAGQVVMKYRKDEETSWTTIFTETTNSAVHHEAINIEATGVNLPHFREIQFRLESTGGAEITGFGLNYTELDGLSK